MDIIGKTLYKTLQFYILHEDSIYNCGVLFGLDLIESLNTHNTMIKTYNGASLYKGLDFNLYSMDDIHHEESKEMIKQAFTDEYEEDIKDVLQQVGISFHGFDYYSPKQYNFEGDSMDMKLEVFDMTLHNAYVDNNSTELEAMLKDNGSYDGYISLTPDDVGELKGELNIITLQHMLFNAHQIEFAFDIIDHIDWDNEEEE